MIKFVFGFIFMILFGAIGYLIAALHHSNRVYSAYNNVINLIYEYVRSCYDAGVEPKVTYSDMRESNIFYDCIFIPIEPLPKDKMDILTKWKETGEL